MKQRLLVLAGVTVLSACSGSREQRAPATDKIAQQPDLTLPESVTRTDTSVVLSSRNEAKASPVQEPRSPASRPAKTRPRPVRHRVKPPAARANVQPEDTAVRGYAPSVASSRAAAPATTDTATSLPKDSVPRDSVRSDSVPTDSFPADSVTSPLETPAESASTTPVDTTRHPPADTVANPGNTAKTAVDTARATDSARAQASSDTSSAPPAVTSPSATSTPPAAARTLPIGTEIHAALDDSITSRRDTVGRQVSGHVMENVIGADGRTLIAAGTPVRFTITQIRPSRSKSSQGRLRLRADGIALGGQLRPVKADIQSVPRELRGRGITGSDAAKVGGGAAAGAVIGGVVGKTKGAVIGGVAGAAAGAVVASQTATRDVVVKARTPVVLVLTAPLVAP